LISIKVNRKKTLCRALEYEGCGRLQSTDYWDFIKKETEHTASIVTSLKINLSQAHWLMPIILAIREAGIGRITVQGQPRQIIHKTPSPK
jgi:hypothetical protein